MLGHASKHDIRKAHMREAIHKLQPQSHLFLKFAGLGLFMLSHKMLKMQIKYSSKENILSNNTLVGSGFSAFVSRRPELSKIYKKISKHYLRMCHPSF